MRYRLRTLLIVFALTALVLAGAVTVAQVSWWRMRTSNCGGNSAALTDARLYTIIMQMAAEENAAGEFRITSATPNQRKQLATIAQEDAHFLVSTQPYRLDSGPRRIVIVCHRPYTNVPRRPFGTAPPTHAVGYSDGSTALLTTTEFAALDRSSLTPLNEILAPLD